MFEYEEKAKKEGYLSIAGIDEAGRGPLAGPVVCAACILPQSFDLIGVNDSKLLTPKKRDALFNELLNFPGLIYSVIAIDVETIDRLNIYQATLEGMRRAAGLLKQPADYLLVDGTDLPGAPVKAEKIIKGDQKSLSIAAASIIAKVTRDQMMCELDAKYPMYGFKKHKGYGTKAHLEALETFGPIDAHRRSFAPVAKLL